MEKIILPPPITLPAGRHPRILLLLELQKDLDLITQMLPEDYEVLASKGGELSFLAFDLAILDASGLDRLDDAVRDRKQSEQPVFLPFLLVTPPKDVSLLGRHFRRLVDEVILKPIRKSELTVRVANLLEMRRLSLISAGGRTADKKSDERRRLEEDLALKASLLDLATDAIYVTEFSGNFIYANEAACRILGYTQEELLGLNLRDLITPESAGERPQRFKELLAKGEICFESTSFRKDRSVLPLEIHARLIDLQGRKVILSVARDITERKQAAELNTRMEAQLRQVQKLEALGTFAGGIAHEFNNVLGAMKGFIELALITLETVPGADKVKSKLEAAFRGGERAKELVKQILAFSRHSEQEPLPLEILPIVKESFKLLRASIPATIAIRQNLDTHCGLVLADPTQISQILMNLTSNAFHAMEEQGGVLEISLEPVQVDASLAAADADLKKGPYVRLTVSDTGHGMDQETLGRIFDPFFTTKEVGKGTGLGLSVIHGIVRNLGGAIKVSSELDRGSTFQVYFPSYRSAAPAEVLPAEATLHGTEHILLVDDETAIVQIGQEYLQRLGYRVTALTSSTEAWEYFRAQPDKIDLVITDLTMPVMTGTDLAAAVLRLHPNLPVILTTGYSETNVMEETRGMGIRQCLIKPLGLRRLGWAVRQELDRKDG